ncbi:Thioredoxin [Fructilactobacillus florum 8D]|uniref:Thioredoxin n=2 Tax=Fructilactobacillus florum TaxID=640331 RepID=W9EDH9_9LACO|nr:Thioredoxin [Fructilactobacillus florum 2F]ETO40132.1 Thioredoxin [Fructilactobacillus florum 8D]
MMEELAVMDAKTLKNKIANGNYLLFFTASWCPDCNFIKPAMPEIVQDFSNYTFLEVDRDANIELCKELDVFGIPSFIAFHDGKEIGRLVNKDRKTKAEIESFIAGLD